MIRKCFFCELCGVRAGCYHKQQGRTSGAAAHTRARGSHSLDGIPSLGLKAGGSVSWRC